MGAKIKSAFVLSWEWWNKLSPSWSGREFIFEISALGVSEDKSRGLVQLTDRSHLRDQCLMVASKK
jgi:hypothetical protein